MSLASQDISIGPDGNIDPYPEHSRLQPVHDEMHAIGRFMDWAQQQEEFKVCEFCKGLGVRASFRKLVTAYYKIDEQKLEDEKRQMIEDMRNHNQAHSRTHHNHADPSPSH